MKVPERVPSGLDARILLKARPTERQLLDRLAPPHPDGLELYLDPSDLAGDDWLCRLESTVATVPGPSDFTWIVEAPIRTLGGSYFDLTCDDDDHRETLRRVVQAGNVIGASAANVHLVAPTTELARLNATERRRALDRTDSLLEYYVEMCAAAGMVPQIENTPPVGRMRESAYVFSPIGAPVSDLRALAVRWPDLRLTVDVSHAGLFLHWRHVDLAQVEESLQPVAMYCRASDEPSDLAGYVAALADLTLTVHVSNASGLLGEGVWYDDGDEDLDRCLRPLFGSVPFFVTETLEEDHDRAIGMRDAQSHLVALRNSCDARKG